MIAISYRREDCTPIAGRLHDRLRAEFGKENVFMDFDSIPYGVDFRDHIAQTLEAADILVAVIGPGWLGHRAGESTRRIDDATDFVRLEIAGALQRGIPVIPILVDTTPMPKEDTLPDDLKPLVFRNALMLDSGIDFHHHADRLITGIRSLLKNIQSASRHGSKERSRSSPGLSHDLEDRRASAGRFKWFGVLDRLRSPAPSQQQDHEPGVKPTSLTSAAEAVTAAPKETSAQSGGTETGAGETALPETSQLIETDRDFERYGGGAKERPKKQLVPLAGSAPELTPPVTVPAVSVQKSSIAPPPAPVSIAQRSGAPKKPQKSFFNGKLLGLVLAGVLVGLVTYFAVTSKMKSTSTRTEAVAQSAVLARQSSASVTPEGSPVQQSTPPAGKIEYSADDVDHLINYVRSVYNSGNATDALKRLEKRGVADDLTSAGLLAEMALLYEAEHDLDRSGETWSKVRHLGPSSGALYELAIKKIKELPQELKPDRGLQASKGPSEETAPSTNSDQTAMPSPSPEIATTRPGPEQAPLLKNGRTWQAWIGDFVRQFVAANQLKDANASLALYAPTVDYFDDHQADQAFIRRDVEKYNERWPIRHDEIEGDIHLQEKVPGQQYLANFKLNFYAESPPRSIWTKGQFAIDLDITVTDEVPKISGIREKLVHQQKGKPGGTPAKNAPRKSYAYGIPIQGKPGFVHSPYAPSKGEIDIRRYPKGAQLKCPFTGKIFIVP